MSTSLFWGIILILIGLSIIIKIVFNIDFSIFRVLLAFVLIYIGIKLFIGRDFHYFSAKNDDQNVVFSDRNMQNMENGKEYNVVFGHGRFDLRSMHLPDSGKVYIKLNTVFADTHVIIGRDIPIEVNAQTVFGGTQLPDHQTSAFGESYYKSDSAQHSKSLIVIEANTVFGGLHIVSE